MTKPVGMSRAAVAGCVIFGAMISAAGAATLLGKGAERASQDYPNRPIRLIAPFAPGGPTDIVARIVAQRLGERVGQTIVVDNRGGAGGAIGCEIAAKAAPDGYTILLGSSGNLAVNPVLQLKLPYEPERDFQPITQTTSGPQIMVIHPSVPAKTVQEFIALSKAKPNRFNFASGGVGMSNHLASELFMMAAHVSITHVPYKGTGPALTDLLSGQVQMMMSSLLPAMPHIKSGRLRGLAVTSANRTAALPDTPTMIESGLPGFETTSWHGVLVPIKTPKAITSVLHAELVKALTQPEVREVFKGQGIDVVASTPGEFKAYIKGERDKWTKVIKAIGLKPQ